MTTTESKHLMSFSGKRTTVTK